MDATGEKENLQSNDSCSMLRGITRDHKRIQNIDPSPKNAKWISALSPAVTGPCGKTAEMSMKDLLCFPCCVLKTGTRQAMVFRAHLREGNQRWYCHLFYIISAQHTSPSWVWEPSLRLQCLLQIRLFSLPAPCLLTISTGKSWGKRYLVTAFDSFGVRNGAWLQDCFKSSLCGLQLEVSVLQLLKWLLEPALQA